MHNQDRGIIKWLPFNSVVSGKEIINNILKEKNKIMMPTLSNEQIEIIENKLLIAFYENIQINVSYFQNGNIQNLKTYIKKIDSIYHKIYLENKVIRFEQIIKIT